MSRLDEVDLFTRTEGFDLLKKHLGIPEKVELYKEVFNLFFHEIDFGGKYISPIRHPRENIPKICAENNWPKKIYFYFKMKSKGRPEAKLIFENIFKEMENAVSKHSNLLILNH